MPKLTQFHPYCFFRVVPVVNMSIEPHRLSWKGLGGVIRDNSGSKLLVMGPVVTFFPQAFCLQWACYPLSVDSFMSVLNAGSANLTYVAFFRYHRK